MGGNIFFDRKGPFLLNILFPHIQIKKKIKILDIKNLKDAGNADLTFLDSVNYIHLAKSTKASYCLTTEKLKVYLPNTCLPILVKNVLFELCNVTKKFYPDADIDIPDKTLKRPKKKSFQKVQFGNNILIGKKCRIGKNTFIGSNTIIENNVSIGNNCIIGSQVVLRNSIIGNGVVIQDGCKIGLKGFGFIPLKGKNLRFPHIGRVLIGNNVEIGANCTIDKATLGSTLVKNGVKIDNLVQVAHNVEIGENTVIAACVGIAGSSSIGKNCMIGGQAGISGHIKIGDRVMVQAQSGVMRSIPSDTTVMGMPAINYLDYNKSYVHFKNLPKIMNKLNDLFKKK